MEIPQSVTARVQPLHEECQMPFSKGACRRKQLIGGLFTVPEGESMSNMVAGVRNYATTVVKSLYADPQ